MLSEQISIHGFIHHYPLDIKKHILLTPQVKAFPPPPPWEIKQEIIYIGALPLMLQMTRCGVRKSTQHNFPIPSMPGDVFISGAYQGQKNFTSRLLFLP